MKKPLAVERLHESNGWCVYLSGKRQGWRNGKFCARRTVVARLKSAARGRWEISFAETDGRERVSNSNNNRHGYSFSVFVPTKRSPDSNLTDSVCKHVHCAISSVGDCSSLLVPKTTSQTNGCVVFSAIRNNDNNKIWKHDKRKNVIYTLHKISNSILSPLRKYVLTKTNIVRIRFAYRRADLCDRSRWIAQQIRHTFTTAFRRNAKKIHFEAFERNACWIVDARVPLFRH